MEISIGFWMVSRELLARARFWMSTSRGYPQYLDCLRASTNGTRL